LIITQFDGRLALRVYLGADRDYR